MPDAIVEEEAIEHFLDGGVSLIRKEIKRAFLYLQVPAERFAPDVALGRRIVPRIGHEMVDPVYFDRQVDHQECPALAALAKTTIVILLAERYIAFHLLGEAQGSGIDRVVLAGTGKLYSLLHAPPARHLYAQVHSLSN